MKELSDVVAEEIPATLADAMRAAALLGSAIRRDPGCVHALHRRASVINLRAEVGDGAPGVDAVNAQAPARSRVTFVEWQYISRLGSPREASLEPHTMSLASHPDLTELFFDPRSGGNLARLSAAWLRLWRDVS